MDKLCKTIKELYENKEYPAAMAMAVGTLDYNPSKENIENIYFSLTIICYYLKMFNLGLDICDYLQLNSMMNVSHNINYYIMPLNLSFKQNIQFKPNDIYIPMNSSIIDDKILIRTVNYRRNTEGRYFFPEGGTIIKTRNYIFDYIYENNNINLYNMEEMFDKRKDCITYKTDFIGFEDVRLFRYKGKLYGICSLSDMTSSGMPQICIINIENNEVIKATHLPGPKESRIEKNWTPLIKDDILYLIYSSHPLIVYKYDMITNILKIHINSSSPKFNFSRIRGSSQLISYQKETYLEIIHEVLELDKRYYYHRFVERDDNFNILRLSRPFTFMHQGTEFCCGLTKKNNIYLATISQEDSSTWAVGIEDKEIEKMLINPGDRPL